MPTLKNANDWRIAIILAFIITSFVYFTGCAGKPAGSVQPPPPPPITVTIELRDFVTPSTPIAGATAVCGEQTVTTNDEGRAHLDVPSDVHLDCAFTAEGYEPNTAAITPNADNAVLGASLTRTVVERPQQPRPLPLFVEGNNRWFGTSAGRADYREITFFSAQSRMLRGEGESHVRPVLQAFKGLGLTATRVLLTLGGDYWDAHSPMGYSLKSDPAMPGYWERLDELVEMHAQEGLWVRLTIFGALEPFGYVWDPIRRQDGFNGEVQRQGEAFARQVASRYANADNVVFEVANEPVGIGFKDSSAKLERLTCELKRLAPARLIGIGDVNDMDFNLFFTACADYIDRHVDRTQDLDFFAAMKRMGEDPYRDAQPRPMPAISGEPVNFGEARRDGRTGDIAGSPAVAYAYGAVTRVRQIIPNFHYDGGLYATLPLANTIESIKAFNQALDAIPMLDAGRWRGNHSLDQGNYWSREPYPGSDDAREVEDHVRRGYGPWRVFGIGDYSVAFPYTGVWNWGADLVLPAQQIDAFTTDGYIVGIYRKR